MKIITILEHVNIAKSEYTDVPAIDGLCGQ
jgi:hypothetical protein